MKQMALAVSVAILASSMCLEAKANTPKDIERTKHELKLREQQGLWKQINWSPNLDTALAAGREQNKPILFVLVVGKLGKKNTAEC